MPTKLVSLPKFGPDDTVIVSLDTLVLTDIQCSVDGALIPFARALRAREKAMAPKYCGERCMHTEQMRMYREGRDPKRKTNRRHQPTPQKTFLPVLAATNKDTLSSLDLDAVKPSPPTAVKIREAEIAFEAKGTFPPTWLRNPATVKYFLIHQYTFEKRAQFAAALIARALNCPTKIVKNANLYSIVFQ